MTVKELFKRRSAKGGSAAPSRPVGALPLVIALAVISIIVYAGCFTRFIPKNFMRYLIQIFLYVAMGEMWNLMSGFAGITSLGQQLYIGLAGYTLAVATSYYQLSLGLGLFIGLAVNLVVSTLLALFLFRIRGMYFTIATWVVAEAFMLLFLSWEYVGMGSGLTIRLARYPQTGEICVLAYTLCAAALVIVFLLLKSKIGIGLTAMRDDITAAAAAGVNIVAYRFLSYVLAAVFIGLAGGLFFVHKGNIYPESGFSINWTVSMVFIVIIGGAGTYTGPIVGAVIYVLLEEYLAHFPGWSNIILGFITLVVILFFPKGIMGTVQGMTGLRLFDLRGRKKKSKE